MIVSIKSALQQQNGKGYKPPSKKTLLINSFCPDFICSLQTTIDGRDRMVRSETIAMTE